MAPATATRRRSTRKATKPQIYIAPAINPVKKKGKGRKKKATNAPGKSAKLTKDSKKIAKYKEPKVKKHPNDKLIPRTYVTECKKDPTFESNEQIPFASVTAYSKLAIRAVLTNNMPLLKRLRDDVKHVSSLHLFQSFDVRKNALSYALEKGHWEMVDLLSADYQKPRQNRVSPLTCLLDTQCYGPDNFYMLGHRPRVMQMSQGDKEGNYALKKDDTRHEAVYVEDALKMGIEWNLLQKLIVKKYYSSCSLWYKIYIAIRNGHHKLAGELVKEYGQYCFNELHREVLQNDSQNLKQFRTISVKKKGRSNRYITPIHCACINPNPKYLRELIAVERDFNHADRDGWRATHYAAVCEGPEPLELLLSKGAPVFDVDKRGNTPLHHAARTGRVHNVEVLIKKIKEGDPKLSPLNKKNRDSHAAIHLAAIHSHTDVIKVFIGAGANVELCTSHGSGKFDALMYACQQGNLELVKYLIEKHNSIVNKRDKLKRTPLIHACLNGHANVVSYLLRIGADPDLPDSSGHTAVHYAAAYGWFFCLKLLAESGADLNKQNDSKLSPLIVAYMKGHIGLADYLLDQANIQINSQDERGMSLVALTINAGITDSTQEQLSYLLKDKKASATITDTLGNTPLHMLAIAETRLTKERPNGMDQVERRKEEAMLKINAAELLIKFGCDPEAMNDWGKTAMTLATQAGNIEMAEYLVGKGSMIGSADPPIRGTENILHLMVARSRITNLQRKDRYSWNCVIQASNFTTSAAPLFQKMANKEPKLIIEFLNCTDSQGYTPFLLACNIYSEMWDATDAVLDGFQELIIAMIATDPTCILHKVKEKKVEGEEDEEDQIKTSAVATHDGLTCFHLAFSSNPNDLVTGSSSKKTLLSAIINHIGAGNPQLLKAIEERNREGHSALMAAVANGDSDAAEILINAGANVNCTTNAKTKQPSQVTVLMEAIDKQMISTAKLLMSSKANVNAMDSEGNTALHYAAQHPTSLMSEVMDQLLRHGAQLAPHNNKKRTPLHTVCNSDTGKTDASTEPVEILLRSATNPVDSGLFTKDIRGRIPLHYVFVKMGNHTQNSSIDPISLCSLLLNVMQDQPEHLNLSDNFKQTPLHCAAKRGSNICCMTLLHYSAVDFNSKDINSNTLLGIAVANKHKDCALTLLRAHANIEPNITMKSNVTLEEHERRNKWKWNPLKEAPPKTEVVSIPSAVVSNEWQGMFYLVMNLLPKDFDTFYWFTSISIEHHKYNLALGMTRKLKGIVKPSNVNEHPPHEETNLFRVLAKSAIPDEQNELQLKLADTLTNIGIHWCSISVDTEGKMSIICDPLTDAIKNRNFTLIKYFKEQSIWQEIIRGCSVHDFNPITAMFEGGLSDLTMDKCKAFMQELVEEFQTNKRSVHEFVDQLHPFEGPADITDLFCRPNLAAKSTHLATPLIYAIKAQNFALVKFLICTINADCGSADSDGVTPLMHAIQTNNKRITKILLNNEDYESPDEQGQNQDNKEEEEQEGPRLFGKTVKLGRSQYSNAQSDYNEDAVEGGMLHDEGEQASGSRKRKNATMHSISKKRKVSPKSKLNLKAADKNGMTALHHCVQPFSWGGWSNVELATLLIKLGAPLDAKDKSGSMAQDIALRTGQFELVEVLNGQQKFQQTDTTFYKGFQTIQPSFKYDLEKDAANFLLKERQRQRKGHERISEKLDKQRLRPHHLSSYQDIGEIVVDEDNGQRCSVLLNNMYGGYNFYWLQLIKRKHTDLSIVFTNWGTIGDQGQHQCTPFVNLQDAKKEYCSVFSEKTDNDWVDINNFQPIPKKYRLVQQNELTNLSGVQFNLDFTIPSKRLPKHLQTIVADMSDITSLQKKTKNVPNCGRFLVPFGRIKRDNLLKAREIVQQIADYASVLSEMEADSGDEGAHQIRDKVMQLEQGMADLSEQFYQLIPFRGFQQCQMPVIAERQWKGYLTIIENLLGFEIAGKILCGAAEHKQQVNPLEYIYDSLETHLELLAPDGWESQAILHYMTNTKTVDVVGIYKIYQAPGKDKVQDLSPLNRKLLWYGTSAENLLGILKVGLLAAPPMERPSGHLFGKGICTTDVFAKSTDYCTPSRSNHHYALLCEVALGNQRQVYSYWDIHEAKPLPLGFDSLKGMGREAPNENYQVTLHSGAKLPLGALEFQKSLENRFTYFKYNKYIVYKAEQVAIRYLVVFK